MIDVKQAVDWAVEAGELAMAQRGKVAVSTKLDGSLVTEADKAVEALLRSRIRDACPDHHIVGEEMGRRGNKGTAEYCWAIDPIDGTVNYASGLPHWGVSAGLLRNNIPVLGVVHLPEIRETYWAVERRGAHFNGKRCKVTANRRSHDEEIFIVPSYISEYSFSFPQKVRSFGSTAAHLCYVARGTCVGALLEGWSIWDVAAGLCILQESGAEVTDLHGIPRISLDGKAGGPLLACSPVYRRELIEGIRHGADRRG
ncbi:MAG: hypothetical protein AUJ92_09440 [Armatimonadetes bacterium CG2_30_59_28]|nr:inositol monophosphatase [Armatimonadota bacterium]OIO94635.1 MAG: hypothetical protein AUJ92_09440 [Armatimonadetes bacterium CG2_30_59_28]PIU61646.1 MAG: inositol-phosphate phosphatase [Armatimonadetes bacterium CG07_land_8_20_14_0_80_59_28]PIX38704.1 MAG: inositol-phosphate phosphatase [Armatimonadetes bacterium CG_4_8_14_3_um_filter_58_9]PIY43689.1 MAG: inositol-phosphate phosphatase [Armatimonadetes bacterium CG_4_10_14_3_um_filter_59_10]PJB67031.1 MAG: inositol-phosphate phosphatase [